MVLNTATTGPSTSSTTHSVAAIVPFQGYPDRPSSNAYTLNPHLTVVAIRDEPTTDTWGVLTDGNDVINSNSEYVQSPLLCPQLHFTAHALFPTGFSSPIDMLIDPSSTSVLIRSDLVDHLQLRHHPLPSPFHFATTLNSASSSSEWVKLCLFNPSLSWSAGTVRAIVIPELCDSVILGLPWLMANNVVINAASHTITS